MRKEPATSHVGNAWRLLLKDLGLDERAVLRRAKLPLNTFEGEGTHLHLDAYYALHDAVEAEAQDPTLALRAGKVVSIELFDPALFAAICSPDMNTAATRLGQFKRLVGPFSLDVDIDNDATQLRYRAKQRPDIQRSLGLAELVFLVAFARRATRHEIVPTRVTVQTLPDLVDPYQDFLGCRIERSSEFTVLLDGIDARRPFLTHNAQMWEAFEPALRRRMDAASDTQSVRDQVEAALFELLPSGRTEMSDVARELGVGLRTLQRRLSAEGTNWRTVLGETRERLARHYLRSTSMSPAEVSFLLGFEDPNSLFRAFHRWTGTTPEAWRAATVAAGHEM